MSEASQKPALLGGTPVRPDGPPAWPLLDNEVHESLETAFRDGSWGVYSGINTANLEALLKEYLHVEHVLLCGSGTFAVEVALRALGSGPGVEVIQAAYDYPGNLLTVHAVGATPVLVDVAAEDWNLSLEALAGALGPTTRGILISHLHGGIVPMRELMALARHHGLWVIEDAAQCPGALIQGKKAGTWGDAGILSFGGSKLLSAGRGGAFFTADEHVMQRARTVLQRGNNQVCPLSELQAAVLIPQIRKLDERNERRWENVKRLHAGLDGVPGLTPFRRRADDSRPGFYKLGFKYDPAAFGLSRTLFVAAMRAEGIAIDEGFAALHVGRSPRRFRAGSALEEANKAHEAMVILHHPVLLEDADQVDEVIEAAQKVWTARAMLE